MITDSLSPRYVALLIAAALLERGRDGSGQHIDVAQIETGVYSLSEMVVRCSANGESVARAGNREEGAAPHGVYPCAGEDAWIARRGGRRGGRALVADRRAELGAAAPRRPPV
jgi:benzylsuccinate CoA-transferase BbsF subunit